MSLPRRQEYPLDVGASAGGDAGAKVSSVAATLGTVPLLLCDVADVADLSSLPAAMFQGAATRGQGKTEVALKTVHQNTVMGLCVFGDGSFSTSGLDGKVVVWQLNTISDAMAALKL
jgi:hypothetical protein